MIFIRIVYAKSTRDVSDSLSLSLSFLVRFSSLFNFYSVARYVDGQGASRERLRPSVIIVKR